MRSPLHFLLPGLLVLACASAAQPRPAGEVVAEARALFDASRLPEAREPLEALLAREPRHLEASLLLAGVYDGLQRREDAIRLLEPLLKLHPNDARVVAIYAGQCLLRAGELGAGFRALRLARRGSELMERAIELDPQEIAYREGLVDFYRQAPRIAGGSREKAFRHAEGIARLDPVRGASWQATLLLEEGRPHEALAAAERALAARPDDYAALFTFGRTVSETGLRLAEGDHALRSLLARQPGPDEPTHAAVWFRLGLIAERNADPAGARAAYEKALALEPGFSRPAEALRRLPSAL